MPFILTADRVCSAIDPATNSRMFIQKGPDPYYNTVMFSSPEISLRLGIAIRRKFPDQPVVTNDPKNPCVMIRAEDLNRTFSERNMHDIEGNTRLVEYLISMIAFINRHYPLGNAPFLWSNHEKLRLPKWLYRMPSDDELLRISSQPEQETSSWTGA
jgi:hypothetical protein